MLFQQCRRAGRIVGLVLAVLIFRPVSIDAQATGSLSGGVTDGMGGIIVDGPIELTHEGSRAEQKLTTSGEGR